MTKIMLKEVLDEFCPPTKDNEGSYTGYASGPYWNRGSRFRGYAGEYKYIQQYFDSGEVVAHTTTDNKDIMFILFKGEKGYFGYIFLGQVGDFFSHRMRRIKSYKEFAVYIKPHEGKDLLVLNQDEYNRFMKMALLEAMEK